MGSGLPLALRRLLVGMLAIGMLVVAGCGGGGEQSGDSSAPPKQGGVLHFAQLDENATLDQFIASGVQEITTLSQIVEPLFKTNKAEETEPWLVSKFEKSQDLRTWTFQLREGVKFSDGTPMTADDVVFTLEKAKASPTWGSTVEPIGKVRATSPSTVVVEAEEPTPAMPAILSLFATGIIPKDFGGASPKEFASKPIGTGPFMVGAWKRGEALTLDANPHYWQDGRPYLDQVVFDTVPEDGSRVAQLKGGELDVIAEPPWSQLTAIENTPGVRIDKVEDGFTDYLILNSQNPLLKDPRAREAMSLALNREDIVAAAMSGFGKTAGSFAPLSLRYADPSIEAPAQDIAKAKDLLGEATKATGEAPDLTLTVLAGDSYARTAGQIAQQNLQEAGFTIEIRQLDLAAAGEALAGKEYDVTLLKIYSTIPDPVEFFAFYIATEGLFSGAPMDEVEKLNTEAAHALEDEERRDLYYEIQEIIDEEHFLVTMDDKPWVFGVADDVSGFYVNATGTPWLAEVGFSG